jgi:hypothetical protein
MMAHGNVNNSIKALMSFLKMSVQQPMKDRHMHIRQQMRLSKTLYKKGLSKEIHQNTLY